ncbi:MAG: phosphatase PAP2 family protein [Prosthecobacter sp.]|nr:phosphatase PAP2 family protein [Prosthecobacter sp.]
MTEGISRTFGAHPLGWAVGALCLLMFVPGLDLAFSGLFYAQGAGFFWDRDAFLGFVREAAPTIIIGTFVFCLLLWITGMMFSQSFLGITTRKMAFLLSTLLLGPGLVVETVLKSYWGRARPNDTVFFGGEATFTPPMWIGQECAHNCSFVSGHAALAFWMCAYGFLLPAPWRRQGIVAGLVCGLLVGLVRVIQGAHFLSDVVFAGAFVLIVNTILARLILPRDEARAP